MLATSSNLLVARNKFGLPASRLKKELDIENDIELEQYIEKIFTVALRNQIIPAKIVYDKDIDRYIYVQEVSIDIVVSRIKTPTLLLFMFMYYFQKQMGKPYTLLSDLTSVVDSSILENPKQKLKQYIRPLLDYFLVSEDNEKYKVTALGETFMTPVLLKKITDVTMERRYSLPIILEFFKQVTQEPYKKDDTNVQLMINMNL
jgi:hypothetical protein